MTASRARVAVAVLGFLCATTTARGGVPCFLDGSGGVVRRGPIPVTYNLDPGDLGPLGAEEVREIVREATQVWADVPSASVGFAAGRELAEDVGRINYWRYFAVCGDGLSPLILDSDGSITNRLFGVGASEVILGFTTPDCDSSGTTIGESSVVLNGSQLPGDAAREAALAVLVHELGHVLNLCHSRLNAHVAENGDPLDDVYLPTMFPFVSNDDPTGAATLALDDRAMLSLIYPSAEFFATTGTISGRVVSGERKRPVSGTEIVVRSTVDPLGTAQWTTSGLLPVELVEGIRFATRTADGSLDGAYQTSGLPPGSYTVEVRGGLHGESPEFYSGPDESGDPLTDPPHVATPVNVAAGEVRIDVTIELDHQVDSSFGDSAWEVTWNGSASVPGESVRLPDGILPAGLLELLSTGGYAFELLPELNGEWLPRRKRRFVQDFAYPDVVESLMLSLFRDGTVRMDSIQGKGRINRKGTRIRGRIEARGKLLTRPRQPLTVRLKYTGRPAEEAIFTPSALPPLAIPVMPATPEGADVDAGG